MGVALVFLAMGVAIAIPNQSKWSVVPGIIGIIIGLFIWGIWGSQYHAYLKFVREILTGQTREEHVMVKHVGEQLVYKDNRLMYYEVEIQDSKGVDRTLLYDFNQEKPSYKEDTDYTFIVHGHYILGEK
jgi:hypothetical protein